RCVPSPLPDLPPSALGNAHAGRMHPWPAEAAPCASSFCAEAPRQARVESEGRVTRSPRGCLMPRPAPRHLAIVTWVCPVCTGQHLPSCCASCGAVGDGGSPHARTDLSTTISAAIGAHLSPQPAADTQRPTKE